MVLTFKNSGSSDDIKKEILNIDYGSTCFDTKNSIDEVYDLFKNKFKNQFVTHFDLLTEKFKLLGKFDITKELKRIKFGE